MNRWKMLLTICLCWTAATVQAQDQYDIVIYGGTSAGVIAAVQAKKMGKSVVVVGPDIHLGGLSAGGLGYTDSGRKNAIGGLSREFYHRVWKHYQNDAAWKFETKKPLKSQGPEEDAAKMQAMWVFEPHVAEQIFEDFVKEYQIPVLRNEYLDRKSGVVKENDRIVSIKMLSGKTFTGKMFIDATYEGDLMAAAGVKYHVGREANSVYGETLNGIQLSEAVYHGHHFKAKISPYVVPGDPSSGLLARISADPPGKQGEGDHRVQAYCYRTCLTNHDDNRIPFPKPAGYDPKQYELMIRVLETGWRDSFRKFDAIPNAKTDTNNHGPFSFDNIGYNYDYPEASYERRKEILDEHTTYQQGLHYFLANDPRVPQDVRDIMSKWGLPKDEFKDNGGWPHQIYVREARRMIGGYVMTEMDCRDQVVTPDSIGMGSYNMDSHNTQRFVTPEGFVQNEGDIQVGTPRSYEIAYGALVPQEGQAANLLVPVCCSSSHIAYGSIRMEPVFMILGQSSATAAAIAIDKQLPVQKVPYGELSARLLQDGQVLETPAPASAGIKNLPGIVVDDSQATYSGSWQESSSIRSFLGTGYRHDGNTNKGAATATFKTKLTPGKYDVRISYVPNTSRATNVPVLVEHANGKHQAVVDQRKALPTGEVDFSLGVFEFKDTGTVSVSNAGTTNYVVVDAVRFVPVP